MGVRAGWIAVTREDREAVGCLEPVAEDCDLVRPRTLVGHRASGPTDLTEGEERLAERGIGELLARGC